MTRLSKNILYNLFGQSILLVLGFIAIKYIFKRLGEDALGIIYFITMLNTLLSAVLNMGIGATTVREVSAHFKKESSYIKDMIRTFSFFYWAAYILLAITIFFLAPIIVKNWISLKTMDTDTAIDVIRILGIASFVVLPKSLYISLFRGLQRMEVNNIIDVATMAFQQFGTIIILTFGGNIYQVIYWFALCYALGIISYIIISARFFSFNALIPFYYLYVIKRNFNFAFRMMLFTILSTIHGQMDKLIISKLMPVGAVGYYSIAYGTCTKGQLLTGAVIQAAYPSFSELYTQRDHKTLLSQYRKLQDLLCFGIVPIYALIPFVLLPLFSYIFNKDTAKMLLFPTTLLSIGFYMNGTINIPHIFSLAVGKPEIAVNTNFYALFFVLPITALLIYYYGLKGAGFSFVLYHIFYYIYGVRRICNECLYISIWKWYLHIIKIFSLAILTYGTAWAFLDYYNLTYSIFLLVLAFLGATTLFFVISFLLIGEELKEVILQRFQSLKRLFKPS